MTTIKCFRCRGKTRQLIRLAETFRGVQRTQNTINQCVNQKCPEYDSFTSDLWVINRASDYVKKTKGKKELGNNKVHDSGELGRPDGESKTKNKKNRWPTLGSKGERVREMARARVGQLAGLDEEDANIHDVDTDDWSEPEGEALADIEDVEGEDGLDDSLEGT